MARVSAGHRNYHVRMQVARPRPDGIVGRGGGPLALSVLMVVLFLTPLVLAAGLFTMAVESGRPGVRSRSSQAG